MAFGALFRSPSIRDFLASRRDFTKTAGTRVGLHLCLLPLPHPHFLLFSFIISSTIVFALLLTPSI